MNYKTHGSERMTESITQKGTSFGRVSFTNAISSTSRRRPRFNLRLVMLVPAVVVGLLLLSACQQVSY